MAHPPNNPTNHDELDRFWQRISFHDMVIEEISALNRRVIIRLTDFTLVVTGVSELQRCELPTTWLYQSVTRDARGFSLDVETETGHIKVSGVDVRILRNNDLAILVPPLDPFWPQRG